MALKNYTTEVDASKTVGEIQAMRAALEDLLQAIHQPAKYDVVHFIEQAKTALSAQGDARK